MLNRQHRRLILLHLARLKWLLLQRVALQQSIFSAYFLAGQGYPMPQIIVNQDNQSTIKLISNGRSNSELTRRIQIGYYWVKDLIDRGLITVVYCPTESMIADLFTKPLQGTLFNHMRQKVTGISPVCNIIKF